MITPEWRAKVQQTADNMHVPVYVMPDGTIHHLKRHAEPPKDAEVFYPANGWRPRPHGDEKAEKLLPEVDVVPPVLPP